MSRDLQSRKRTPVDDALAALTRVEQMSDLHCVTTWTRRGLRWSGWSLREVYERLIVPSARPSLDVTILVFRGLDGYRSGLTLDDALARDVLLADGLDEHPRGRVALEERGSLLPGWVLQRVYAPCLPLMLRAYGVPRDGGPGVT